MAWMPGCATLQRVGGARTAAFARGQRVVAAAAWTSGRLRLHPQKSAGASQPVGCSRANDCGSIPALASPTRRMRSARPGHPGPTRRSVRGASPHVRCTYARSCRRVLAGPGCPRIVLRAHQERAGAPGTRNGGGLRADWGGHGGRGQAWADVPRWGHRAQHRHADGRGSEAQEDAVAPGASGHVPAQTFSQPPGGQALPQDFQTRSKTCPGATAWAQCPPSREHGVSVMTSLLPHGGWDGRQT